MLHTAVRSINVQRLTLSSSSDTPGVSSKWQVSTDVPSAPTWSDDRRVVQ